MLSLTSVRNRWFALYWPLFKSRQTLLLTLTGAAGYLCQRSAHLSWPELLSLIGSLLVIIAGCSVLNMIYDRDIDRMMKRTSQRPLAAGQLNPGSAAFMGSLLIGLGLIWAAALSLLYFAVVLVGAVMNLGVYTVWLKRRSAWSILWGGVAGGMPILAGRLLAVGQIDLLGLLLALVVVFWIPSHNLTLTCLHSTDYVHAGVPTFINVYGPVTTRRMITLSSLLTALLMLAVFLSLGASVAVLLLLAAGGIILVALSLKGLTLRSKMGISSKQVKLLYKYSSIYMLVSMLLLALNGII